MKPLEGLVIIKSKRICHRTLVGKIGEVFGCATRDSGLTVYGVSLGGKDYEFYSYELEAVK